MGFLDKLRAPLLTGSPQSVDKVLLFKIQMQEKKNM